MVVKTHEWKGSLEAFEDLKKMLSHIVLSVREGHKLKLTLLSTPRTYVHAVAGFPREENWLKIATHVLHFAAWHKQMRQSEFEEQAYQPLLDYSRNKGPRPTGSNSHGSGRGPTKAGLLRRLEEKRRNQFKYIYS